MNHYEAMFVLHNREPSEPEPVEGEEAAAPVARPSPEDVVRQLVEKCGGTVAHTILWANRKLAYPIAGNQTGTYVLAYVSGPPAMCEELNREVRLSDRMLRSLMLRIGSLPEESELPGPLAEPTARPRSGEDETTDGKPKKVWEQLDYKEVYVLRRMISSQGKVFSRLRSNLEAKNQRKLRRAVYRARNLALLPFVGRM